ncbi:hypothetical protein L0F63_007022, partial [Massospora cicadina]
MQITKVLFHKDNMPLLNYLATGGIKVLPKGVCASGANHSAEWACWHLYKWSTKFLNYNLVNVVSVCAAHEGQIPHPHATLVSRVHSYDAMMEDCPLNSDMIKDYEKHHSDLSMRYIVWVFEASMEKLDNIKRYASKEEIMTEFYVIRLQFYQKYKKDLESKLMQK